MFLKREMRPQTAGAPNSDNRNAKKLSSIAFNTANDAPGDFGSFDNEPETTYTPQRRRTTNNQGFFGKAKKNKKTTIILVSAIAAVALIVIGFAIAAFAGAFGSGDIEYANNAYLTYISQDKHYVMANGEIVEHEFQGEVELIPSADNSFAYVIDNGDDGLYLYVLEGTKLTSVSTTPAEEFITYATLEPGIIFTETGNNGTKYMFYSPKSGIQQITKETKHPGDFHISADAKTVVYTVENDDGDTVPQIYENGVYDKLADTGYVPVAISSYGDYVYVTKGGKLGIIDRKKNDGPVAISGSSDFGSILEMNVKGDEIVFCTVKAPNGIADMLDGDLIEIRSYLYRHNEKNDNVLELSTGYAHTAKDATPDIAVHSSFAKTYFETTPDGLQGNSYTFRLTDKYEIENIYDGKGKFTPDGDYFYYISKEGDLYQLDLNAKARDVIPVYEDVKDFAITEKSNIYILDSDNYLVFYKASTKSKARISSYADEISIYRCANKLYFSENTESAPIYVTEEGSEKDIAKLGTTELKDVPYFSSQVTKKGYAAMFNEATNSYSIFYTSNGNRFKLVKAVTSCDEITHGVDFPAPIEW